MVAARGVHYFLVPSRFPVTNSAYFYNNTGAAVFYFRSIIAVTFPQVISPSSEDAKASSSGLVVVVTNRSRVSAKLMPL